MKTICCVLKSGGDFEPKHVEWLRRQCAEHMPDWRFQCWSDMDVPDAIPLTRGWPKWWSKFEIHGTDFDDPALVVDLDMVWLGTITVRPEHENRAIFWRNPWKDGFRKPEQLAGGFSYLPKWARERIWNAWKLDSEGIMQRWSGDDQPFMHALFAKDALRWQDHYLDQVVSYKAQVQSLGVQPENKAVLFHGTPRPWDLDANWIPKLPDSAEKPQQECL